MDIAQKGRRRQHGPEFKAQGALVAAAGDRNLAGPAAEFDLCPTLTSARKNELPDNAAMPFGKR